MIKKFIYNFLIFLYKIIGFAILIAVCMGLLAYLTSSIFYLMDKRWIIPLILTQNSKEVIQTNTQFIQQKYLYDKMMVEKLRLENQYKILTEEINFKKNFQKRFHLSFKNELEDKKLEIFILNKIIEEYEKIQFDSLYQPYAYKTLQSLIQTGMIDRESYYRQKFSIDQSSINFSSYKQKLEQLKLEKTALEKSLLSLEGLNKSINKNNLPNSTPIHEILLLEQEYEKLSDDINRGQTELQVIKKEIEVVDSTLIKYSELRNKIKESPYYKATNKKIIVAFSPYPNLKNIKIGDPIYGCYFGLIFCKKIARVKEILDGEITAKHPIFNKEIRGLMILIDISDKNSDWAKKKALHVNTKPLFLF